jgi:two-component system CheB/CheR fusion protein
LRPRWTGVGVADLPILSNLVGYDGLLEDTQAVLDTLIPKELEVQTKTGDWYLLRIQTYRTPGNAIEGAVLTFFNVTEMKRHRRRCGKPRK